MNVGVRPGDGTDAVDTCASGCVEGGVRPGDGADAGAFNLAGLRNLKETLHNFRGAACCSVKGWHLMMYLGGNGKRECKITEIGCTEEKQATVGIGCAGQVCSVCGYPGDGTKKKARPCACACPLTNSSRYLGG